MNFWDIANIANSVNNMANKWNNNYWSNNENINKTWVSNKNSNFSKKKKVPFKEQLKNTFFLLKNTFKILGRNKDIVKPTMFSVYYSLILRIWFYVMIVSFVLNVLLWLLLLLIWIIAFIYKFFYLAKQKANQSYLVYNIISWNNISYKKSLDYTKNDFNKYKSIAFIDMARWYIDKANDWKGGGIKWMLIGLILSWLEEVLDLISNYLLPAMVIENKSMLESKDDLKAVKDNVPQTLAWVFWIDFLWSCINSLLWLTYLIMIVASWLIGWLIWYSSENIFMAMLPSIITFVIISLISIVILRLVDGVKVVYFTVFYTSIMKSESITDDLKDELQNYLQFKEKNETKSMINEERLW